MARCLSVRDTPNGQTVLGVRMQKRCAWMYGRFQLRAAACRQTLQPFLTTHRMGLWFAFIRSIPVSSQSSSQPSTQPSRPLQPLSDSFVVNLGEMLQIVTNGCYRATVHRCGPSHTRLPFLYSCVVPCPKGSEVVEKGCAPGLHRFHHPTVQERRNWLSFLDGSSDEEPAKRTTTRSSTLSCFGGSGGFLDTLPVSLSIRPPYGATHPTGAPSGGGMWVDWGRFVRDSV